MLQNRWQFVGPINFEIAHEYLDHELNQVRIIQSNELIQLTAYEALGFQFRSNGCARHTDHSLVIGRVKLLHILNVL
jgi:hypothetical protein